MDLRASQCRRGATLTAQLAHRERLLEKFLAAAGAGDRKAVMALLAEGVEYTADCGGKLVAAVKILHGPERCHKNQPGFVL